MPSEKNISLIDANVILRYLLKDKGELYAKAERVEMPKCPLTS